MVKHLAILAAFLLAAALGLPQPPSTFITSNQQRVSCQQAQKGTGPPLTEQEQKHCDAILFGEGPGAPSPIDVNGFGGQETVDVSKWNERQVAAWLRENNFGQYEKTFTGPSLHFF